MDCIFCKIGKKEIPSNIVYEDELVYAILDISPSVLGHTLIIPKEHYEDFFDLPDELILHLNQVKKSLSKLLIEKLKCDGLSLAINYGSKQDVKHFHLHLLPANSKYENLSVDEVYKILMK